MTDEMYLTIATLPDGSSTSVAVNRLEALTLDRDGFIALYKRHVYGAKKKDAEEFADNQIRQRAAALKRAKREEERAEFNCRRAANSHSETEK